MIIGVKYWNRTGTAPGSWTNLDCLEVDIDFEHYIYDEGEAIDGTEFAYGRNKYFARLVIDPLVFNHGTYGPVVTALRKADFFRVYDTRKATFGSTNTIDFVNKSNRSTRSEPTDILREVEINGRAVVVHT